MKEVIERTACTSTRAIRVAAGFVDNPGAAKALRRLF